MGKKKAFKESLEGKGPENKGKSGKSLSVGIVAGVLVAAAAAFLLFGGGPSSGFATVKAEAGGTVRIPLSEISDGQAHFYTYKGNKSINFFVLKSSDGVIRAALDACDVCYASKKGYRQEGDTMVCNNCGQRFPSARINEVKGGCNPAPLNRYIDGQYLVLNAQDIETGAFYF